MKSSKGFTLIELMIVVAIIAILASIGFGAKTQQDVKNDPSDVASSQSEESSGNPFK